MTGRENLPCLYRAMRSKHLRPQNTKASIITICMPIWNRQFCIEKVLDSILHQTYPKESIKIVFVDNCSTDGTTETIKNFSIREKGNYIDIAVIVEKSNLPEARNICVRNAVGEFTVWWDSDVLPPDNHILERSVNHLKATGMYAIVYPCFLEGKDSLYGRINRARLGSDLVEIGGLGFSITVMRRSVFDKIGFFNEKSVLSEEEEFYLRFNKAGFRLLCDNRTPCTHLKTANQIKTSWLKRYFAYVKRSFLSTKSEYDQFLNVGSAIYRLRLATYFLLPFAVFATFLFHWLIGVAYFSALLAYQLYKSKGNRLLGFASFIFNLLPGLTISYGYIYHKLKRGLKK